MSRIYVIVHRRDAKDAESFIFFFSKINFRKPMIKDWYKKTHNTWGNILDQSAENFPSNEAIIFKGKKVTYRELKNQVDKLTKGLINCGVEKGETVAIWMTNCLEWVYTQFAIYKLGAIMLPIYTRWKETEVKYSLKQSDTTTLVMMDNFLGTIDALEMLKSLCPEIVDCDPEHIHSEIFPELKRIILLGERNYTGMYQFNEVMKIADEPGLDDKLRELQDSVDPFDVMNIMYTSGTTGFPKGGLSMHRNNLASVYHIGVRMNLTDEDRLLVDLPFFSNFGCMFSTAIGLLNGSTVVLNEVFDPKRSLLDIQRYKITHFFGSPTMFIMMLDHPDFGKYELSSLRGGLVGGAPVPQKLMKDIIHKMGAEEILNVYGLSECGGAATTSFKNDSVELKSSTVGFPLPHVQLSVVDPESGKTLNCGEQGEIRLKDVYPGSCVGKGYYKMPDKTSESITDDGWFKTGDLGILENNGYLRFTGRLKEMFLVGGFNVYSVEIENFLHTHPKVKQAHVIGVPDKILGEVPMAFIEPKASESVSEEEIINFCKKSIANYKVPRCVKFVQEEDIPLTGSGKVRKFMLREEAIKEFGLKTD